MSAPLVSQMVSDLEARLGVQLLNRTRSSLTLTPAGQQLFDTTSSMLNLFRDGLSTISPLQLQLSGRLRICAPTTLESSGFARFLQRFTAENSDIELELDLFDELIKEPEERYDLTLRFAPLDTQLNHARLLLEVDFLLVAAPCLLNQPMTAAQLNHEEWVHSPNSPTDLVIRKLTTGETDQIRPSNHLRVSNIAMVRRLVEEGIGFGTFPDFSVQQALDSGKLVNVMPDWITGRCGLFSIIPPKQLESSAARRFVDDLDGYLKNSNQAQSAFIR